ncbi:MAG TPA: hypothetical protein VF789_05765 [Thermoanaerobaculia bacterium]
MGEQMYQRAREARPELAVGIDEALYFYIRQGNFEGGETEVSLTEEEVIDVIRWLQEALSEFRQRPEE